MISSKDCPFPNQTFSLYSKSPVVCCLTLSLVHNQNIRIHYLPCKHPIFIPLGKLNSVLFVVKREREMERTRARMKKKKKANENVIKGIAARWHYTRSFIFVHTHSHFRRDLLR